MATNVGIDLTDVDDVRASVALFGRRYLERVYTPAELSDCHDDPERLAGRFAAKEATIKALRADGPIPWRSIEVRSTAGGPPVLDLSGLAAQVAKRRGVQGMSLSITHERGLAAAVVLAEAG